MGAGWLGFGVGDKGVMKNELKLVVVLKNDLKNWF